ncbi:glycosyltransferase [Protaetiibacter sp. SSC-01]|nr:glycosyltransferase [Protaetiibacter sp. SSC-01]
MSLRYVLDEILDAALPATGSAAEQLARALIRTAPEGAEVIGLVSASPEPEYAELAERLPGLAGLEKSALARRELASAWRRGLVSAPRGMLHSPSLLAPLGRHDRVNDPGTQVAVTLHDALLWTDPETVMGRSLAWQRAMIRRAERYADALVVPSHAVAAAVAEHADFGDRVRVIPLAPAEGLTIPHDALARLRELGLPNSYVLSFATPNPRHRLGDLLEALLPLDVPLVLAGDSDETTIEALRETAGFPAHRLVRLGRLGAHDRAAVQAGAAVFVQPSREEGFGLGILESFALGAPVVCSDAPAFVELVDDAAEVVSGDGFAEGLRSAIARVLDDEGHAERLSVAGRDRARAFSWRDSAEKVWQLHADL